MVTKYRIHPAVGIARMGNSPDAFYLSPENPAQRPQACDANGNPRYGPDGTTPEYVTSFKDRDGRINLSEWLAPYFHGAPQVPLTRERPHRSEERGAGGRPLQYSARKPRPSSPYRQLWGGPAHTTTASANSCRRCLRAGVSLRSRHPR